MRTGIIGAGKVGCSLGKYFRLNNLEVTGYYDVNENLAKEAADFTATAFIKDLDTIVKESDTLFLTVPDDLITIIYLCDASIRGKQKDVCNIIRECGISRRNTYNSNPLSCKIGIDHTSDILTYPIKDTALQYFVWSSYTKPLNTFYEPTNLEIDDAYHLELLLEPDDETSIYYNSEPLK